MRQGRMSEEQAVARNSGFVTKTATATLKVSENLVYVDSSAGVAITITLPPAAECFGMIFVIYVIAYSGAVTLGDGSLSRDFSAPTLNGVDDGQALWCDGQQWWPISTRT
jgi:hypothetical protein